MAGRSRKPPRPDRILIETDQLDGITWPTLRAIWQGLSDEEIERRHLGAVQLIRSGWGAVDWGLSE